MKQKILSWLLFHANTHSSSKCYYAIKNKLLEKYGTYFSDDVQFLEGKKCRCCGGSGIYVGYTWYSKRYEDCCRYCIDGWYHLPTYVILKEYQFGKYTFHQPYKSVPFKNPLSHAPLIEGYIEHKSTKYGSLAKDILYLLYDRTELGRGWYLQWYNPKYWINNLYHLFTRKSNSIPVRRVREKLKKKPEYKPLHPYTPCNDDDLPF